MVTRTPTTSTPGGVHEISLDHDLGEDEGAGTGYDVAV